MVDNTFKPIADILILTAKMIVSQKTDKEITEKEAENMVINASDYIKQKRGIIE